MATPIQSGMRLMKTLNRNLANSQSTKMRGKPTENSAPIRPAAASTHFSCCRSSPVERQPLPERAQRQPNGADEDDDDDREQWPLRVGEPGDAEGVVDELEVEEWTRAQREDPGDQSASEKCERGSELRTPKAQPAVREGQ